MLKRTPRMAWRLPLLLPCACVAVACGKPRDPPGAEVRPPSVRRIVGSASASPSVAAAPKGPEPGSTSDNVPFEPNGTRLASLAWRTWIYTDTGPNRSRFGYLRAGAVVDARGPAIVNAGCAGGWYRVNPRGFVCLGKGATLAHEQNPIVVQTRTRPTRGAGLPYRYVMADDEPPHLYFRLPTAEEMRKVEGDTIAGRVQRWTVREQTRGALAQLGELGEPPAFLHTGTIEKPYGVKSGLHYSVHAGRAAPDSGFALLEAFLWEGRPFALTTGLDLVPLDRTRVVKPSEFRGVELGPGETLPVGMVQSYAVRRSALDGSQLVAAGEYTYRQWVKLAGPVKDDTAVQPTTDGGWVAARALRLVEPRTSFPSFAVGTRKWIDLSIRDQTLVAYVGEKPVYVTLVSTGRGGLGDPEKTMATVRGTFMVHTKHVSATMDGDEDESADSYALEDVPFVQYFHEGYALHGTYWHDEFGKVRSHGCVNLAPIDAAWLFEWTDPVVPPGWHSVLNKDRGTVVYIHP